MILWFLCSILVVFSVTALPGLSPVTYCKQSVPNSCQSKIDIFSNRMYSPNSVVPYGPERFDQCISSSTLVSQENMGQILFGERLTLTDIKINFEAPSTCVELCRQTYNPNDENSVKKYEDLVLGIKEAFNRYWVADNIPVTVCTKKTSGTEICERSIPLGCFKSSKYKMSTQCELMGDIFSTDWLLLFNHFIFNVRYARIQDNNLDKINSIYGRIISVQVTPRSLNQEYEKLDCLSSEILRLPVKLSKPMTITYTYSVRYEEMKNVSWGSRWDYLVAYSSQSNIQWLSIANSVIVVLFLTGLVALVLVRTLHHDVSRYNKLDPVVSETQEEFGWKLIHGDVFRAPRYPMLLSVLVGNGAQLGLMTIITLFFACFGILSPAHRGAFATCALATFVCLGTSAGYISARLYKFFGGLLWKTNVLMTGICCPGVVFAMFLFLNVVLLALHSSAAVPFTTILALLSMWLLVSLPLCAVGSFFGFRQQVVSVPTQTNQIPRQIPQLVWYMWMTPTVILSGLLPFGCIFIQLFFILNSIWGNQLFFMFGLLFVVFSVLVISTTETTILLCYFQLCAENYQWCWHSFLAGGSTTFYVILYSIYYYIYKTEFTGLASYFLYFSYTMLSASLIFLMLGSIGFISCFFFVRKIYAVVKVD